MGYSQLFKLPTDTLPTGLVAYYPFNGNANDESGNGYNGTVNGATLTTNRFGINNTAYEFDGVNDYIESLYTITNLSSITISCWIQLQDYTSNNPIITRYDSTVDTNNMFYLTANNGYIRLGIVETMTNYLAAISDYQITNANWNFITGSFDMSSKKFNIYINGKYVKYNTISSGNLTQLTASVVPFKIGKNTISLPTVNYFFNGKIDDIRIYSKVLSNVEIKALYRQTPTTAL